MAPIFMIDHMLIKLGKYLRILCPSCGTVFWKGSHVRNACANPGREYGT